MTRPSYALSLKDIIQELERRGINTTQLVQRGVSEEDLIGILTFVESMERKLGPDAERIMSAIVPAINRGGNQ